MEKAKLRFFVVAAVVIFVIGMLLPGYTKLQDLIAENERLESRIETLTVSIADLEAEKSKLENDILYIEKVARDKLGVAREDEVVIKEAVKQ